MNRILAALNPNIPNRAFQMWLVMNFVVFAGLHMFATRPVSVHVADFREPGLTDDQVVVIAVRALEEKASNFWWMADRTPVLVVPVTAPLQVEGEMLHYASIKVVQRDPISLSGLQLASLLRLR